MNVVAFIFTSLVSIPSLVLGYTYVLLGVSLGFAHELGFIGNNVMVARWRPQPFPWHSWLRLGLLGAISVALSAFLKAWVSLSISAVATAVAVIFLYFATKRFSTTIGHGIILHHRAGERTTYHELFHVRQYEDACLLALFISLPLWLTGSLDWVAFLALWGSSGAPWLLPNFVTAFFRYTRKGVSFMDAVYMGALHEQAAYAVTETRYRRS